MGRRRILWQLYPSYLLITLIAVVAITWYGVHSQQETLLKSTAAGLESRVNLVMPHVVTLLDSGDTSAVDDLCKRLGRNAGTRLTVVLASGAVVADSDESPQDMENHGSRPEISEAMRDGVGMSMRYSSTLQNTLMYVAVRFQTNDHPAGVIRAAIPISSVAGTVHGLQGKMAVGGLALAMLAALVGWFVARRITRPIEDLRIGAERFASGDLGRRLALPPSEEIGALAEAMNKMATQLKHRIDVITKQRQEQEAILASMVEGVMAVDRDERILNLNDAAARLLSINPRKATGRTVQEIIRNTRLQEVIAETLDRRETVHSEISIAGTAERLLQVSSGILRDADGRNVGAVIVLNDVTRLRKLERLRRDFVANVSHELKTPITSIKGSVETLLDGAVENSVDARRFLDITARQTDRLNQIVDDLLSLSRIETEAGEGDIEFDFISVRTPLDAAGAACERKASAKAIRIEIDCDVDLRVRANSLLLEQAVVNLLDNAIKHSSSGSTVEVIAGATGDELVIAVQDQGCGIETEHLSRLFERFYRVDKARSRELGGTGLGLAIVKHIVLAHGGRVQVSSEPEVGSRFEIRLPMAPSASR